MKLKKNATLIFLAFQVLAASIAVDLLLANPPPKIPEQTLAKGADYIVIAEVSKVETVKITEEKLKGWGPPPNHPVVTTKTIKNVLIPKKILLGQWQVKKPMIVMTTITTYPPNFRRSEQWSNVFPEKGSLVRVYLKKEADGSLRVLDQGIKHVDHIYD
jgi:hypothetical protein